MDMPKRGLGRGLGALLGDYNENTEKSSVTELNIRDIDTNLKQPRKDFNDEKLAELSASIKRHGIVQPIVVRQKGDRFSIVAGERRYRAARLAGLEKVPVVIRAFDERETMEVALIENLQRENLNPMEEAFGIQTLMEQYDLTQEDAAARLGKSRPAVANSLRLLTLCEPVKRLVTDGSLQAGHARVLAGLKDEQLQQSLAQASIRGGWSVREMEARAKLAQQEPKQKPASKEPQGILKAAQDALREHLGTGVKIEGTEKRGKITIEYYSEEALSQIYDTILGN